MSTIIRCAVLLLLLVPWPAHAVGTCADVLKQLLQVGFSFVRRMVDISDRLRRRRLGDDIIRSSVARLH